MKIIDLSWEINAEMPLYPGTEKPSFLTTSSLQGEGYREVMLHLSSHTGTHLDAPAHMLPSGKTLGQLKIDQFCGQGRVVDCRGLGEAITGRHLQEALSLRPLGRAGAYIEHPDFLLLLTGWDKKRSEIGYFSGYPVLTEEAVQVLVSLKLKGIGIDLPSVDSPKAQDYPRHRQLLQEAFIVVENLTGLERLLGQSFIFSCFPLKIYGLDGCPVRAVAMLQDCYNRD